MKNRKLFMGTTALLLVAALFIGCGRNAKDRVPEEISAYSYGKSDEPMVMELDDDMAFDAEMAYSTEKQEEAGRTGTDSAYDVNRETKLVYRAKLEIETLNYKEAVESIRSRIREFDGFIEKEDETDSANNWYYTNYEKTGGTMKMYLTVRIPTKNYDAFLQGVEGSGKVVSRSSYVDNITKRYYETETTIQSLTIQEERLLEMMKDAKGIEEMLKVEARLTDVQQELAQYKNSLSAMDTDVMYSTVSLTIREVVEYTPDKPVQKTSTFGERFKNTVRDMWEGLGEFAENALFFLISALPYLLLFVALPLVIILLVVKNKKKKKAEAKAKAAAEAAGQVAGEQQP